MDLLGHGTHVAGIVKALGYGVARNAVVYGVKVLEDAIQDIPEANVLAAMDWILAAPSHAAK